MKQPFYAIVQIIFSFPLGSLSLFENRNSPFLTLTVMLPWYRRPFSICNLFFVFKDNLSEFYLKENWYFPLSIAGDMYYFLIYLSKVFNKIFLHCLFSLLVWIYVAPVLFKSKSWKEGSVGSQKCIKMQKQQTLFDGVCSWTIMQCVTFIMPFSSLLSVILFPSRKHAYIILTHLNPTFI